jgi:hypothetical protein
MGLYNLIINYKLIIWTGSDTFFKIYTGGGGGGRGGREGSILHVMPPPRVNSWRRHWHMHIDANCIANFGYFEFMANTIILQR